MAKKRILHLISILAILLLSNLYSGYINIFTEGLFKSYLYQTENAEFEFWTMPSKGRDIELMEKQFSSFIEKNPIYSRLKLRRTFKREPFKFWNWYSYMIHKRYNYIYQKKVK